MPIRCASRWRPRLNDDRHYSRMYRRPRSSSGQPAPSERGSAYKGNTPRRPVFPRNRNGVMSHSNSRSDFVDKNALLTELWLKEERYASLDHKYQPPASIKNSAFQALVTMCSNTYGGTGLRLSPEPSYASLAPVVPPPRRRRARSLYHLGQAQRRAARRHRRRDRRRVRPNGITRHDGGTEGARAVRLHARTQCATCA